MYNLGTEELVICVGYNDVQRVIEKEYGLNEFCIPVIEEIGNDATLEITVDGRVCEWDQRDIKARKQQYNTRAYMNDLAKRDLIKKGVYMIDVSW